jgi:DNA-binding MarR family transcriptional regulator
MPRYDKSQVNVVGFLEEVEFRDAALLSYVTSAIIVPAYDEIKRDYGVIRAEYVLLLCLSHYPVLTAQDVSRLTGRPRNSISRAVNRMLKEGYIKRVPDPDDGRQARLSITSAGRTLHTKISTDMTTKQEHVLSALTAKERDTLAKLLRKTALHVTSQPDKIKRGAAK